MGRSCAQAAPLRPRPSSTMTWPGGAPQRPLVGTERAVGCKSVSRVVRRGSHSGGRSKPRGRSTARRPGRTRRARGASAATGRAVGPATQMSAGPGTGGHRVAGRTAYTARWRRVALSSGRERTRPQSSLVAPPPALSLSRPRTARVVTLAVALRVTLHAARRHEAAAPRTSVAMASQRICPRRTGPTSPIGADGRWRRFSRWWVCSRSPERSGGTPGSLANDGPLGHIELEAPAVGEDDFLLGRVLERDDVQVDRARQLVGHQRA